MIEPTEFNHIRDLNEKPLQSNSLENLRPSIVKAVRSYNGNSVRTSNIEGSETGYSPQLIGRNLGVLKDLGVAEERETGKTRSNRYGLKAPEQALKEVEQLSREVLWVDVVEALSEHEEPEKAAKGIHSDYSMWNGTLTEIKDAENYSQVQELYQELGLIDEESNIIDVSDIEFVEAHKDDWRETASKPGISGKYREAVNRVNGYYEHQA